MRTVSGDRSDPADDLDLRRGDPAGPEAERNQARLEHGLAIHVLASSGSV